MSERTPIPREVALEVAREIHARLAPFCEKCTVAGSLRRERPYVHDIEFLFIPKMAQNPQGFFSTMLSEASIDSIKMTDMADLAINRLEYNHYLKKRIGKTGLTAWGKQNKLAVHASSGIPVDFFSTIRNNWFVALVIRTGGKRTNLRLTVGANLRGLRFHAYGDGFTNLKTGEKIHCASERDVFRIAGVPYREPPNRL